VAGAGAGGRGPGRAGGPGGAGGDSTDSPRGAWRLKASSLVAGGQARGATPGKLVPPCPDPEGVVVLSATPTKPSNGARIPVINADPVRVVHLVRR
jgi:hypothetical protein